MTFLKFRTCIVTILSLILIITACTKDKSDQSIEKPSNLQYKRTSGVVEDDPNIVSKIPVIISSDLLKRASRDPSLLAFKGKPTGGNDLTPPTISISSPTSGATVSGTISITVNAADNRGVSSVSLSVDGILVSSSTSSPFTISWNSATVINGTHTLTVTAKDAAGNSASASKQVTVNTVSNTDVSNPSVNITSPASGASVTGTVDITANASDNINVSSVKFSIDGIVVGTDNSSPYSYSWSTTSIATGIHTVTATAYDGAGNTSSQSIQVTVNITVINPPSLPASVQLITPPVGNQGNEGSCVAFSIAYAARSIEQYYKTNAGSYGFDINIFSPEYAYNQTKIGDCGTGTSVLTVLDLLKNQGVCTWQSMPYSDVNGCSLQPTSSQVANAANYKIFSYSMIPNTDQVAIKTMLSSKHPIITTIIADNSFINAGPGFIWKTYSGSGALRHSIIICGYDDTKHAYKVMNSFGASWGDAGFCWIDYDFFPQKSTYDTYVIQ